MAVVVALLPILVALGALLLLRLPVWVCALGALVVAGTQALLGGVAPGGAGLDLGVALWAEAALVILPGLALNAVLKSRGTHREIGEWVARLPLSTSWKHALVVFGIGPALESLTGFGVSLLVTVPVLLSLSNRTTAVRQATLGMAIVPWGTVGLATAVGATLAGVTTSDLGLRTAFLYAVLMPVLGAVATGIGVQEGQSRLHACVPGIVAGSMLGGALVLTNALRLTPVAGILSGALVAAVLLARPAIRRGLPGLPFHAVSPYVLAVAVVVAVRLIGWAGVDIPAVPVGDAHVELLTSPGLALLLALLVASRGRPGREPLTTALGGWRTLTAIGAFVLAAQLMVAVGSVQTVATAVAAGGAAAAALLAPVLGLGSGFITGSGTSGNALMMVAQASIGSGTGLAHLTTAVQNAGAGTGMMLSLPTATLIGVIAQDRTREGEQRLVRFNLAVLAGLAVLLIGASALVAVVSV